MKADIKQHIVKGKNYSRVEKQGEKPTFSNYSFVEIKGSIPDLFPDHDFIELREKDEPHYIDKIKIHIIFNFTKIYFNIVINNFFYLNFITTKKYYL